MPGAPTSVAGTTSTPDAVASGSAAPLAAGSTPVTGSFDSVLGDALTRAGAAGGLATDPGAAGDDVGAGAVAAGSRYLGVPYVWGGSDPATGLDCSGLVQRAYADVGVTLPRVAADQARMGSAVPDLAHARPGDLLAFGSPVDHIGIYVGAGRMLVAPRTGEAVMVQDVYRIPTAIRRITGPAATATPAYAVGMPSWVPERWRPLFAIAAARHGVPAALLASVARTESGFNAGAVSPAGAVGLMQLMPSTARGLGVDPRDPAQAIDGAARLLAGHLRRFGSAPLALAAYNAGPGAVERYDGVPPYRETQQYVSRVLGYAGMAA
ncbi:transglycosylase SLT domain-containing protein [Nostocoides sp. HKS02]|nr:transglycosylase SLT domain-containing protein [Tetrasphaera sp. HKS02]